MKLLISKSPSRIQNIRFENIKVSPFTLDVSVRIKWQGTMETFFFSAFLMCSLRFDLISCWFPCSVPFWVVPLLECTSSTNAGTKTSHCKKRTHNSPKSRNSLIKVTTFNNPLHCTSRHSYQGLSYLTPSIRGNLRLYGAENTSDLIVLITLVIERMIHFSGLSIQTSGLSLSFFVTW